MRPTQPTSQLTATKEQVPCPPSTHTLPPSPQQLLPHTSDFHHLSRSYCNSTAPQRHERLSADLYWATGGPRVYKRKLHLPFSSANPLDLCGLLQEPSPPTPSAQVESGGASELSWDRPLRPAPAEGPQHTSNTSTSRRSSAYHTHPPVPQGPSAKEASHNRQPCSTSNP